MIGQIRSNLNRIRESWTALIFPVLSDLVFLLMLGFLLSPLFNKVTEIISMIGTNLIEATGAVTGGVIEETFIEDIIAYSPDLTGQLWSLVGVLLIILLMLYFLTTAFQAISWHLCRRISGANTRYYRYLIYLLKVNIVWMILFGLVQAVDIILKANAVFSTPSGVIPSSGWGIQLTYLLLIYFASASYTGIRRFRRSIRLAFKKEYITIWIVVLLWFLLLLLIQSILPYSWILLYQIIITLPSISIARILLISSTRKF